MVLISVLLTPPRAARQRVFNIGGVVIAMFRISTNFTLLMTACLFLSCNSGLSPQNDDPGNNGNEVDDPSSVENPIRARVRNESPDQIDVTLRFLSDQEVAHLAFVRVPPETITTISGPQAQTIELSGVNERGEALSSAQLLFGIDFDRERAAEYVVRPGNVPPDEPGRPAPPSLTLSPIAESSLVLGQSLEIRWSDSGSFGAVVTFFLRPVGDEDAPLVAISPAIGVALDGINDSLITVVEGVAPGEYELIGRVDDGDQIAFSVASESIQISTDPGNAAPTISLVNPRDPLVLSNGDPLTISWVDEDADDNATIVFSLVPADENAIGQDEYVIGPPIAENSDKSPADSATITFRDVLPGLYDLVARIDDGRLMGTDRAGALIRIVPAVQPPGNGIPSLTLIAPDKDFQITKGASFVVQWTDSDPNDNARIWLLLDSDSQNSLLNGNEYVLASSFEEDPDGPGDQISVVVPREIPSGVYRLVSVISDGLTQVVTRAPAQITVRGLTGGGGGDTNPGGGGGDGGGDGDGPAPTNQITLVPSAEIVDRPGELITVVVTQDVASIPRRSRVLISNQAYGGGFELDITPFIGPATSTKTYTMVVQSGLVPNAAWPRSFDIVLESILDGIVTTSRTPRPIWIRQEVEVQDLRQVNYVCDANDAIDFEPDPFVGIEWTWYGGGFGDGDQEEIAFWLSSDALIPANGQNDGTHKLIAMKSTSPNQQRIERIALSDLRGAFSASFVVVVPGVSGLDAGWYWLIPVLDPNGSPRQLGTFSMPIRVCQPVESLLDGSPP